MSDPYHTGELSRLAAMVLGGGLAVAGCFLLVKILRLFDGAAEAFSQPQSCESCSIPLDLTDCCPNCGVWHGDPCRWCGQRGYHKANCPELGEGVGPA